MIKVILLFLIISFSGLTLPAQTVTYGPFAGTQGNKSSYFGLFAGQQATAASSNNSFFGAFSGVVTKSPYNSGFGTEVLFSNSSGSANTATGYQALYSNTTANFNTANGYSALWANKTGYHNIAIGSFALYQNTTGFENTAIGHVALQSNVTGENNTASGHRALRLNKSGSFNTASGAYTLESNTEGIWNTAFGGEALKSNITGSQNTATGLMASYSNSRGVLNTANGCFALYKNTVGNRNSAFGANAGPDSEALENTTALGYGALTTSSNSVRIGNANVTSIGGQVMWTTLSDGRFKRNIREDVSGLNFINQLRPVSYEVDKAAINRHLNIPDSITREFEAKKEEVRETGFIAQDVEAVIKKTGYVFNGIEAPQNEHDHYSIRYAAFVVPLVKAVQELATQLNEQRLEISALKQKLGLSEEGKSGDINSALKVELFQNNPNPFSLDTEITMVLPESTRQARVVFYSMEGKELKNIPVHERGNASIKISSNDLGAGMYLYALIVDGKVVDTKRLILAK